MDKFLAVACVCTTGLEYLSRMGPSWSVWTQDAHDGGIRYRRLQDSIWG
jgi:hypothetical protein